MCLQTLNPRIYIAERDILVYKYIIKDVNGNSISFHKGFLYEEGKKNPTINLKPCERFYSRRIIYEINEGYHAYVYKVDKNSGTPTHYNSYFLIPKGSSFILEDPLTPYYQEIVSSDIIYLGMASTYKKKSLLKKLFSKSKSSPEKNYLPFSEEELTQLTKKE